MKFGPGKALPQVKATVPTVRNQFASIDDLPFTLSVKDVANALGLSTSKTYQLMSADDFPRLGIGRRVIVLKAKFIEWMEENTR